MTFSQFRALWYVLWKELSFIFKKVKTYVSKNIIENWWLMSHLLKYLILLIKKRFLTCINIKSTKKYTKNTNAKIWIGTYILRFKLVKLLQTVGTWSKVSANIGILLSKFKPKSEQNFLNQGYSVKIKRNHYSSFKIIFSSHIFYFETNFRGFWRFQKFPILHPLVEVMWRGNAISDHCAPLTFWWAY